MKNWCCCKDMTSKQMFSFLLGITFGGWLLYLGASKWCPTILGPSDFVGWIQKDFESTWLPGFLVTITAWLILVAEPVIGLMLVLSRGKCRLTWLLAAAFMFMLLMGQTIKGDYAIVANIWHYLILCIIGACFAEKSCCLPAANACSDSSKDSSSCCGTQKTETCCSTKKETDCCSSK